MGRVCGGGGEKTVRKIRGFGYCRIPRIPFNCKGLLEKTLIVISKHLFIQYLTETMSLDEKCPMTRQAEDKSYFSISKEIKSININERELSTKKEEQKFKEISEPKDVESRGRDWV